MEQNDYDSPWKEIMEKFFPEFLEFFFPEIHAEIDWQLSYEFLDKEFQQITKDAEQGRRLVDKLVKVWRKDGQETWVLIHIEIQGAYEKDFPKRMFVYNYRIFDLYDKPVVSLALLTDANSNWRPDSFEHGLWGSKNYFCFPVVKLIDCLKDPVKLEESSNPFAICTLAQLKAHETAKIPASRKKWKFIFSRRLYERGFPRQKIIDLFRFIDWAMALPEELENDFWQEIQQHEKVKKMEFVTSVERIGFKRGMQQGMQQGTRQLLSRQITKKFGQLPADIKLKLEQADEQQILDWSERILTADSIANMFGN